MAQADITKVLIGLRAGDRAGFDALLTLTYAELRRLARSHLRRERAGHTLHATELVHEVWFKLLHGGWAFENRAHFFGAASRAMRRILVDHARRRAAHKRQGERDALGVSRTTVSDDWRFARAWLHNTLVAVADPRPRERPDHPAHAALGRSS